MILHTPVPFSEIFPEEPKETPKQTPIPSGFVETDDDKILDVFSTNPADYLKFTPGSPAADAPGFPTGDAPGFPTGSCTKE